jgi:RHS repeat-associated protein
MRVSGITDSYPHTVSYYIAGIYGTEAQKRADTDDPQTVPPAAPQVATTTEYFDLFNHRLAAIDPLDRATYFTYDSARRLATETAPEGNSTAYTYDARSNLLTTTRHAKPGSGFADITSSVTYEEGPTVASCASPSTCNKQATSTDSLGRTTSYFYRSNGQLQRVVKPAVSAQPGGYAGSPQTDYCYAPQTGTSGSISFLTGTVDLVRPGVNRVHSYTYDSAANHVVPLTETIDPSPTLVPPPNAGGDCPSSQTSTALGLTSHIAFDRMGNISGVTDPRGNTTSYVHDAMRRLTAVIAPLNELTRTCYNADGLAVSVNRARAAVSDPNASTQTTTGQCSVAFPPADWQSDAKTYFTTGDLQSVTDSNGFVTTYAYDPDGRVQVVEDGDGRDTATVFDLAGQTVGQWRGGTGWIDIGGTGLPSSTAPTSSTPWAAASYPGFGPILYGQSSYNANGTRHSEVDANGGVTTFGYDGFDRMTSIGYPDGKSELMWYTLDGTPATSRCSASDHFCRKIMRSGQYVAYHYNELDHEDQRTPQVEGAYAYGQNLLSEVTQVTKSAAGSAPAHATSYDYDGAGRKAFESNDSRRMSFGYDPSGNRNLLTWPDNYSVSYQYDALNRMSYVLENGVTELAYFHYNPLSQRDYACFGGQSTNCQQGGGTNKTNFAYDNNGDLNSIGYVLNGTTVTVGYGHNRSHQINSLNATDGFYLPAVEQGPTSYSAAPMNQYSFIGGNQTHYDDNGNLKTLFPSDGAQTFTYDSENRLIRAAVGGSSTDSIFYDYDALERRVTKTVGGSALAVGGTTTNFLLVGQEEVAELDGAGNVMRRYIPGPSLDERIVAAEGSSTTAPVRTYFHVDHAGSVRAMTDASGNVTGCAQGVLCQQLGYDDFGNLSSGTSVTGVPYRFTGRRFDAETGLYYYRARYYSPSIGRFMQMDPIGTRNDPNLYAYTYNDPLNHTDPQGESDCVVTGPGSMRCTSQPGLDHFILHVWLWAKGYTTVHSESQGDAPTPSASNPSSGSSSDDKSKQGTSQQGQSGETQKIPNDQLKAPPSKRGNAPVGEDDHPVELHHDGQKADSPLQELTRTDHRGGDNFKKNHENTGQNPSEIDRSQWRRERRDYWSGEWDRGRFDDMMNDNSGGGESNGGDSNGNGSGNGN